MECFTWGPFPRRITKRISRLDTPGKDSFRHRQAGAAPSVVVTRDLVGVYLPRTAETDFYDRLAPLFSNCELVLIEGHLDGPGIKIEVWR